MEGLSWAAVIEHAFVYGKPKQTWGEHTNPGIKPRTFLLWGRRVNHFYHAANQTWPILFNVTQPHSCCGDGEAQLLQHSYNFGKNIKSALFISES